MSHEQLYLTVAILAVTENCNRMLLLVTQGILRQSLILLLPLPLLLPCFSANGMVVSVVAGGGARLLIVRLYYKDHSALVVRVRPKRANPWS